MPECSNPVKFLEEKLGRGALESFVGPVYGNDGIFPCRETKRTRISPWWRFRDRRFQEITLSYDCFFCGTKGSGKQMKHFVRGYGGLGEEYHGPDHYYFHPRCLLGGEEVEVAERILKMVKSYMERLEEAKSHIEEVKTNAQL